MQILIAMPHGPSARNLAWELENQREEWSCRWVAHGMEAAEAARGCQVLIVDSVLPGLDGSAVLHTLQGQPAPPFTLLVGAEDPLADRCLPRGSVDYAAIIEQLLPGLPRLYDSARGAACARYFLNVLGFPCHLKGSVYLGWMLTAILGNPELLRHLTDQLYPGAAALARATPAAVERCARHAIEALWSRGNLNVIEQYFGQSVDPEKGKPTTREFLAMGLEHCLKNYTVWMSPSSDGEEASQAGASS